ncbi:hypothetical protein FRC02_006079 [Tulasnella sp. 418]|nr:hypothetical protein FRC02_006079 [Tulasnella sp. 418]
MVNDVPDVIVGERDPEIALASKESGILLRLATSVFTWLKTPTKVDFNLTPFATIAIPTAEGSARRWKKPPRL